MEAHETARKILSSIVVDVDKVLEILLHETLMNRGLQFGDAQIRLIEKEDKHPRISIVTDKRHFEILDNGIVYEFDPTDNAYMKML